jgi:hypothetical protein
MTEMALPARPRKSAIQRSRSGAGQEAGSVGRVAFTAKRGPQRRPRVLSSRYWNSESLLLDNCLVCMSTPDCHGSALGRGPALGRAPARRARGDPAVVSRESSLLRPTTGQAVTPEDSWAALYPRRHRRSRSRRSVLPNSQSVSATEDPWPSLWSPVADDTTPIPPPSKGRRRRLLAPHSSRCPRRRLHLRMVDRGDRRSWRRGEADREVVWTTRGKRPALGGRLSADRGRRGVPGR